MNSERNPMYQQIIGTSIYLSSIYEELENSTRSVLSTPEIYNIRRIVIIGSGDSFFAAKAAEFSIMKHSKLPVEVRTSLDGARYHSLLSDRRDIENTLVIALSNSGMTSRTCEAVIMYKQSGANTLAITQNASSLLSKESSNSLILPSSELPIAPNFCSFICSFLALVLFGLRIGEVRMKETMDKTGERRKELLRHIDDLSLVVKKTILPAHELAEKFRKGKYFEFVGTGSNIATADYGAAKILEAVGRHATARDLEEWIHLNYFDSSPEEISTILLSPNKSRSESRLQEIYVFMRKIRKNLVVVGGGPLIKLAEDNNGDTLRCEIDICETWSPMLLSAPIALFAAYLSEIEGSSHERANNSLWEDSLDAGTVQKSKIMGMDI